MRKSDFNLKFYTMSYLFCLLNFIFRKVLGFNNEIYLFSWEAYFIHFKMRYCRCFSCKYLLRYELKTECGQFLHFLTGLFMAGIVKLNFPIFFMIYSTAQLGDISVMFRRCLLWDSILRLFSRILFSNSFFNPLSVKISV